MSEFNQRMKRNINHAQERLDTDFIGSKEAMLLIAKEKVREFQIASDTIIHDEVQDILSLLIVGGMYQAFSYGYGIGKVEGETLKKIIL